MTRRNVRDEADYREAARILRGHKDDAEDIQEDSRGGEGQVQQSRQASEQVGVAVTVTHTENAAGGAVWGSSRWNYSEYGDK